MKVRPKQMSKANYKKDVLKLNILDIAEALEKGLKHKFDFHDRGFGCGCRDMAFDYKGKRYAMHICFLPGQYSWSVCFEPEEEAT